MGEAAGSYTIEEFTASDGYVWRYRRYPPRSPIKAEVVFIHGIQSHAGWYEYSCQHLAAAGFGVAFLDRRGSGVNQKDRGDAPSFRRLLDDVAEYLAKVPRTITWDRAPARLPLVLAGISWGGKLAVALERRHPALVDGLMLLCPGFYPRVHLTLGQRLGIFATRWLRPRKLFPIPLNDPELFTTNPRWQQFLRDDPLRLHRSTARLLLESARLDGYLRFVPKYVQIPVLVLLAENDRIIHNAKTRTFVDRLATKDKQIIEYAGASHTLEFEAEPDRFIDDMKNWLNERSEEAKP